MFETCKGTIDAIATAALFGKFVIYEVDDNVLSATHMRRYFTNLTYGDDYIIVSDLDKYVGATIPLSYGVDVGPVFHTDRMRDFEFSSVVVLRRNNPMKIFERILSEHNISPNNIFISPEAWQDRTYRPDNLVHNALSVTGPMGDEGLSSTELLAHIVDCLLEVKSKGIKGDILNLGVYKGWSVQFIAEICKSIGLCDRTIYGFDTFSGFTDTSSHCMDSFVPYMKGRFGPETAIHTDTSVETVSKRLAGYENIKLVPGDIKKSISTINFPISFALFDMDDYTPTKIALAPVYNKMSEGGFILHDHYSPPSCGYPGLYGQRRAMDEFLKQNPMFNLTGTNVFVKKCSPLPISSS